MELLVRFEETDTLQTFIHRYSWITIVHGACTVKISRVAMAMLSWEEVFILTEFLHDRNMIHRPNVEIISKDIQTHTHSPSYN